MSEYRMFIPSAKINEVREWFTSRDGCIVWTNKEIGVNRPDVMTPKLGPDGQHTNAPHWAYVGEPTPIEPHEIGVRDETIVTPPVEWFPVCQHCKGTGRRSLIVLSSVRDESICQTIERCKDTLRDVNLSDNTCQCWCCDGAGHIDRHVLVAIRKRYWGLDITNTGKLRAQRLARKLGPDVKWDWSYDRPGYASLTFYTESIRPFTLQD